MTPPPPGEAEEDDQDARPARPLLGLRFWLLIGFAAACVAAGLAVATLGPVWFPAS